MSIATFKAAVPRWMHCSIGADDGYFDYIYLPDEYWYDRDSNILKHDALGKIDQFYRDLAIEHGVALTVVRHQSFHVNLRDNISFTRIQIPYVFEIRNGNTYSNIVECRHCGHEHNFWTIFCSACNGSNYCMSCNEFGSQAHYDCRSCEDCCLECAACGRTIAADQDHGNDDGALCRDCYMENRCGNCNNHVPEGDGHETDQFGILCDTCWPRYCTECGRFDNHVYNNYCRNCRPITMFEEDDPQSDKAATEVRLPVLEGRKYSSLWY